MPKEYQSEKSPIFDSQKSPKTLKKTPYNVSVICCQSLPVVLQHPVSTLHYSTIYSSDLLLVLVLEDGHPQAVGAAATELARHHLADSVYSEGI